MTQRERRLEAEGYSYTKGFDTNEQAKEKAKQMRRLGYRATVLTEIRRGIYYYSVWIKKAKEAQV